MELLYIWIKKYRNIENQGFNISGKYKFEYNEISKVLEIHNIDNYIEGFFNPQNKDHNNIANIINLTAVIGENGTGKTSFLDFIKNYLPEGETALDKPCIIAYTKENDDRIQIFHTNDVAIKEVSIKDKNVKYKLSIIDYKFPSISDLNNYSFVFFSNIFDSRKEFIEGYYESKLINISTNYLLYKDYNDYRNIKYDKIKSMEETSLRFVDGVNPVIAHRKYEFKRQLYFLRTNNLDNYKIDLPQIIEIDINEINIRSIFPKDKNINIDNKALHDYLSEIEKFFNSYISSNVKNKKEYSKTLIAKSVFFNLIYNQQVFNILFSAKSTFKANIQRTNNIIADSIQIIGDLNKLIYQSDDDPKIRPINIKELIDNNILFLKFYSEYMDNSNLTIYPKSILFDKTKNNISKLNELTDLYLGTEPTLDFLDFDWVDFSSGQKAILNIYSRFYEIVNRNVNDFSQLEKDLIILIDEGEIYFHPQWQKGFIKSIINDLSLLLSNIKKNTKTNIQIILTSNSPVVLSDIPKNHVIFLSNSDIKHLEDKKQTFASNIYLLFSDSFFIKNGLIGDFAKDKIDEIIDILNNKDIVNYSVEEKQKVKKLIDIIGEPIIKNKLLQMLEDKLRTNLIDIDERLNKIEISLKNT